MSKVPTITLCIALACLPLACDAANKGRLQGLSAQTSANILAAQQQPDCVRVVDAYVLRTRAWKPTTYFVALSAPVAAGRAFAVLHVDELADPLYLGERKSFHVELDQSCSKVTEELQFQ
ncbi:MAG TPA: hypothetical protein DCM50_09785 [Stenotrophomonas sp.]|nr:hypothetical protein [Stenotrophomonas sp.]